MTKSATAALSDLATHTRIERLEALVAASGALNQASGLDEILQTILTLVAAQLDCERTTVFLIDKRTNKLHARQMSGSSHVEIVLERGRGIAGHVAESGESVLIDDVQGDARFDRTTDLRTGYVTRTMLCVPLRKPDGSVTGSVQAINARREKFSAADLAYLEAFAALAAIAVEREQLAQEAFRSHLISTELELARQIQSRLLPDAGEINLPAPFVAWGRSQSCFDVGGDAYDAVMLPSGECAFWVADVSGKGIGAALLMTTLQTELRALVRSEPDLARLAAELNRRVGRVAPAGTYATLFLGVLDAARETVRYTNAGHLLPIWIDRASGETSATNAELRECGVGGLPIGLLPESVYETGEAAFTAGERLAVFSDGVTDAENTMGDAYNEQGVEASLRAHRGQQVEGIGERAFEDLDRFRTGAPTKDDTTFLVVGIES